MPRGNFSVFSSTHKPHTKIGVAMRKVHLSNIIAMKFMNFRPEPLRGNQHGTEHQTSKFKDKCSFHKNVVAFWVCIMFHLCFCCDNTAITSLSTNKIHTTRKGSMLIATPMIWASKLSSSPPQCIKKGWHFCVVFLKCHLFLLNHKNTQNRSNMKLYMKCVVIDQNNTVLNLEMLKNPTLCTYLKP